MTALLRRTLALWTNVYVAAAAATVFETLNRQTNQRDLLWMLITIPLTLASAFLATTDPEELKRRFGGRRVLLVLLGVLLIMLGYEASHGYVWVILWGVGLGRCIQAAVWADKAVDR